MIASGENAGFGIRLGDDPSISGPCLKELRGIHKKLAEKLQGNSEFFDFGLFVGSESEKIEERIDELTRTCIWHAIALKYEFKLKLLYTIEGYLTAIDTKNPISCFLLARYLLELAATVSEIDFLLKDCLEIDFHDWHNRGVSFLAVLYRARHSTSDEKFKLAFAKHGVPANYYHPIKISKAMKRLTGRHGFASAVSFYHTLSNICHHNGSGHKMLTDRGRVTNVIAGRGGKAFFLKSKTAAFRIGYPASSFTSNSLGVTARLAWWSAHSADEIIDGFQEVPFANNEIRKLTKGKLKAAHPVDSSAGLPQRLATKWGVPTIKLRRNDPCSCGSGKRYKVCCINTPTI